MMIFDPKIIHHTEPCRVTGILRRVWRYVRKNGKDKLVRELKNWMEQINIRSKKPMRALVLRLVWGAGDPGDSDSGMAVERCFPPRLDASLVKNVVVFSR